MEHGIVSVFNAILTRQPLVSLMEHSFVFAFKVVLRRQPWLNGTKVCAGVDDDFETAAVS